MKQTGECLHPSSLPINCARVVGASLASPLQADRLTVQSALRSASSSGPSLEHLVQCFLDGCLSTCLLLASCSV